MNEKDYKTHYSVIAPLIMGAGIGDGKTTACLVAQCATINALRKGKTLDKPTDEMECACPVLRRLAIRLNDTGWWKDDMERTKVLRPLIPLLLDSKGSAELTKKRGYFCADQSVRVLTPMRLEWIAAHTKSAKVKEELKAGIKTIKELKALDSSDACSEARNACQKLKSYAYASASASAYAYAYAYASAYADADADASADAYADAYADADASADAYAYASAYASAYADAQKLKYRDAAVALFMQVAAMKE